MAILYVQPVNSFSEGFYFSSFEEFQNKVKSCHHSSYEFEFMEGEPIDAKLFDTFSINLSNLEKLFEACENWHISEKLQVVICVDECGYNYNLNIDTPDQFDIDLYEFDSMEDLARYFADEGLLGEIPDHLRFYIDYQAIARNLAVDYSETIICNQRLIYHCR